MDTRTREADAGTDTADPGISLSCCLRPKNRRRYGEAGKMLANVSIKNVGSLGE